MLNMKPWLLNTKPQPRLHPFPPLSLLAKSDQMCSKYLHSGRHSWTFLSAQSSWWPASCAGSSLSVDVSWCVPTLFYASAGFWLSFCLSVSSLMLGHLLVFADVIALFFLSCLKSSGTERALSASFTLTNGTVTGLPSYCTSAVFVLLMQIEICIVNGMLINVSLCCCF